MSPVKRICVFKHSVITNFNCACPAIQRGQGSGADAQARLNLRCSQGDKYQIRLTWSIWHILQRTEPIFQDYIPCLSIAAAISKSSVFIISESEPVVELRNVNFWLKLVWISMSHVMRKPVFGVCDQIRNKPAWSACLEILDLTSIGIILSKQRTTKVLIRLCIWADWSALLLFAYGKNRFSHDKAPIDNGQTTEPSHEKRGLTVSRFAII